MDGVFRGRLAGLLRGAALPASGKPCPSRLSNTQIFILFLVCEFWGTMAIMTQNQLKFLMQWKYNGNSGEAIYSGGGIMG